MHYRTLFSVVQVKSYARNHGEPNENDKGYVSISYSKYAMKLYYKHSDSYAHVYRLSLLCAFIFLNILTPVALAKSVSLYFPKIVAKSSKGDFMGCLYWAAAVITFVFNTLYTALSIRDYFFHGKTANTSCLIHHICLIPSDTYIYNDEVITLVAMLIVIVSAVFIELLLSIYAVKSQFNGQRNRHFWKCCLFQTVHVFALWNILITLQLFTKVVIPVCVLLLIHPQVTVLYIAFLLMVPACIIFIAAYLLYHCQQPRREICCKKTNCRLKSVQLLLMIVILGLIMTLLMSYELLLMMQAEVGTGIKGLLLSLLPSFPLSAIGWYLKRRSQKKAQQTLNDKTLQLMTEQQQCMPNCEDENIVPV